MKRFFPLLGLILSLLILATGLAACGETETGVSTPSSDPGTDPSVTTPEQTSSNDPISTPEDTAMTTSENPDSTKEPITPAAPLFSMKEWTGAVNSTDASGKRVNQSDITNINRRDYHTFGTHVYKTVAEAIAGARNYDMESSGYYRLLTGAGNPWQLAVYKNEKTATSAGVAGEFFKLTYDMDNAPRYTGKNVVGLSNTAYYGGFKEVTLPASWQAQGFDFPIYANTQQPWDAYGNGTIRVPTVPTVTNPIGFYRTTFSVDPSWMDGRRVILSFGGVESCYYLWINGMEVGYTEDSYDLSEFDITDYLYKDGRPNLLAMEVIRWCDGSWFENQDMLRLGGIFRDVAIYSIPEVNLFDYQVVTDLDDAFVNATLSLKATIRNESAAAIKGTYRVEASLYDADGKAVIAPGVLSADLIGTVGVGKDATLSLSYEMKAPHLWSDEDPYLYTLVLTLKDKDGKDYGSVSQQLGFRELTFTPTKSTSGPNSYYDTVLLNGKPLLLKGTNRHDNCWTTGKYVSHELCETDVFRMKQLNINALRTSHYPNDTYMYYLCDKYGILVLAEANIESHWSVSEGDSVRYFSKVLSERIESLVKREKNRTSILIWSLDNECNACSVFTNAIKNIIHPIDTTRMIHSCTYTNGGGVDLASQMYVDVSGMPGWGTAANHMPYIQCEFDHAMGNSLGNFYEYWEMFRKYDNLLGGFIWDFVDQTLATEIPTKNGWDYYGNGKYYACGDNWKNTITHQDYCQNGILNPDRELQPEAFECKYVLQSVWFTGSLGEVQKGKVTVYNEFSHVNLSDFAFRYELLCDGKVIDSGSFTVDCAPRATVTVTVPYRMPKELTPDGEYFLNLFCELKENRGWGDRGYTVAYGQLAVPAEVSHVSAPAISGLPAITTKEEGNKLTLEGKDFVLTFDKTKGEILNYTYQGETLLTSGPVMNFTRATIANERFLNLDWNKVTPGKAQSFEVTGSRGNRLVKVSVVQALNNAGSSTATVTYEVYGSGEITVTVTLTMDPSMGETAKVGQMMVLPGDFENVTMYAKGPWENYSDRSKGAAVGRFDTTVSDLFYPYACPQDTGNHTGVRYIALTSDSRATGLLVVAKTTVEATALHFSTAELNAARNTYQLNGKKEATYLAVDYGSRGVGSGSCGPDTLTQYRLLNDGRDYTYTYTLVPMSKGEDPGERSKQWRDAESIGQAEIDKRTAEEITAKIAALGKDPSGVAEVRRAYNALTDAQKALVTNLSLLTSVEAQVGKTVNFTDASENNFKVKDLSGGVVYEDSGSATGWAYTGNYTLVDQNNKLNNALSGKASFALELWARFDELVVGNVLIAKGDTQISIKIDGGNNLEFFVYDGGWQCLLVPLSQAGIRAGEWFHVVCQRTASGLETYVNGKKVGTMAYNGSVNKAGEALTVGKAIGKSFALNGAIGFVHIYSRSLTADEIAAQYASYTTGSAPALTAADALLWLDMDKHTIE